MQSLWLNSKFHSHLKCKRLKIINLNFVDDLLVFSGDDSTSLHLIKQIFDWFSALSGLHISPKKSSIFFGGVNQ